MNNKEPDMQDRNDNDWAASDKPAEAGGGSPGAEPPPKRRALTAARREQNRVAQRAYRKRQKESRRQLKEAEAQRYRTRRPRLLLKRCDGDSESISRSSEISDGLSNHQLAHGSMQGDADTCNGHTSTLPSRAGLSEANGSPSLSTDEPISTHIYFGDESALTSPENDELRLVPARRRPAKSRTSDNQKQDELILPDLYLNMLKFVPVTIAHAVFENALSLGFDLPTIAKCGADCMSPFYQPNLSSTTDPNALLQYGAASASSFKNTSIPTHLRPTVAQVLIPHHASLDLIPLPFLRERAIMLAAAMPNTFTIWELKLDIYERGGMTIWRQSQSPTGNKSYQPWDMESWEAAPWFLKKWTMIIGDEESEFYKQSLGWQVIREVICSQLGNGGF